MTAITGGLVSLSIHALILSVVLILPSSPVIAVPKSEGDGAVMLFDPAKLPPLDEPIPPPTETADQTSPPPMPVEEPKPQLVEVEPPKKEVALGVEGGKPDSKAWIKSVSEGEHSARQSVVEQPALSQDGGMSGPAGIPTPPAAAQPDQAAKPTPASPAPEAQPVEEPSRAPMPAKPDGASPNPRPGLPAEVEPPKAEPKPQPENVPPAAKEQEGPKPLELDPKRLAPSDLPDGPQKEKIEGEAGAAPSTLPTGPKQDGAVAASKDNADKNQPAVTIGTTPDPREITVQPERTPAQAQAPRPEQPATSPIPAAAVPAPLAPPAQTSDTTAPGVPRITDAATIKRTGKFYKSGRVDAGEGLEVRTVRPNYSLYAQTYANPRSPVMEIHFARDGTVRKVMIIRSSGYPADIDEPVVTACYNWQAAGKALRELPNRSDSTVVLTIQFLLN
ncbi:MAG: hypothetical protein ACREJO_04145 [Phycisphaerales bacterium]